MNKETRLRLFDMDELNAYFLSKKYYQCLINIYVYKKTKFSK